MQWRTASAERDLDESRHSSLQNNESWLTWIGTRKTVEVKKQRELLRYTGFYHFELIQFNSIN